MQRVAAVFAVAILFAPAASGQETQTNTVYESPVVPMRVVVVDVKDNPGVHRVYIAVAWADADYGDHLRFGKDLEAGDVIVRLPRNKDDGEEDLVDGCEFKSTRMEHGFTGAKITTREDDNCLGPLVADIPLIGIDHWGSAMTCKEATRTDSGAKAAVRYYGCYWTEKPEG